MGIDSTKSLSKEEQAAIRIIYGRETGRPTIEERELRELCQSLKQIKALKGLGLLDSFLHSLQGDGEPKEGTTERFGADWKGLLGLFSRFLDKDKEITKEEVIVGLGTSAGGLIAPVAPAVALLVGWYLAESYVSYTTTIYQKDEEGNDLKDAEGEKIPARDDKGNVITKTIRPPPILHNLITMIGYLVSILEVGVHVLSDIVEKDPVGFLKKYTYVPWSPFETKG